MQGYYEAQLAERFRPRLTADLEEFARLEFPTEDPRTVRQLVVAATENASTRPRRHLWFSRVPKPTTEGSSAKA